MEENDHLNRDFGGHWAEVVRAYCELMMDEVIPHLPPAEQGVYQRLFRPSHVQQMSVHQMSLRRFGRAVWRVAEYCPAGGHRTADENTHRNDLGE